MNSSTNGGESYLLGIDLGTESFARGCSIQLAAAGAAEATTFDLKYP